MYLEYVSILLRPYRISFLKLQIPASFRDPQPYAPLLFGNLVVRAVEPSHLEHSKEGQCRAMPSQQGM